MGKGTQVVAHEGMSTGTGIFFKCGYRDGHCSTLPIGYPLPSLVSLSLPYQEFSVWKLYIPEESNSPMKTMVIEMKNPQGQMVSGCYLMLQHFSTFKLMLWHSFTRIYSLLTESYISFINFYFIFNVFNHFYI